MNASAQVWHRRHDRNGWRPQLFNAHCDSDKKEWLVNIIGYSDVSVEPVDDVVVHLDGDDVFVVDDGGDDGDYDAFVVVEDDYTHKDRITIAPTNTPYYMIGNEDKNWYLYLFPWAH